ncbi:MAG: VWA domain-containing protein, partial [Acidobacteria bacterium]|nr:VWA domain-containing protein [Acidobacteriota bacterium]
SSRRTLKEATDMAAASNTMIYTIGIYSNRRESNPKALRQLAEITGGEVYFPGNGAQLSAACRHIATDIRSQYTLGYVPTNQKKDGVYREIKVTVNAPNAGRLTVRTRSGYLAR